ncbi:MAG: hypothetical protein IKC40_00470 [Oscillospiraceae bacterium]|nr:hypothetical protein [Oscillospiraceae bacterium]MBR6617494.1 hypothetical protein [Oscillospiraceae bacterium]
MTKRKLQVIIIYENKAGTRCGSPFDPTQSIAETVNILWNPTAEKICVDGEMM